MKICDFTKPELEKFRKECNFTDIERKLEASWEMDPVLMEDELWPRIDKICLDKSVSVSLRVAQELQSSPEVRMK